MLVRVFASSCCAAKLAENQVFVIGIGRTGVQNWVAKIVRASAEWTNVQRSQ